MPANLDENRLTVSLTSGVIFLHAIARTPRSFRKMQEAVEASGFTTLNVGYKSRSKSLEALAEDVHPEIREFCDRIAGQVHFVGHSMGGLLVRAYLAKYAPSRLGRVVMLGTPNKGSEIADRLKDLPLYRSFFGPAGQQLTTVSDSANRALFVPTAYPVGIIAGNRSADPLALLLPKPNDGRVSVQSTMLEGMTDHIVIDASHPWLVRNKLAITQTIAFLQDGKFLR